MVSTYNDSHCYPVSFPGHEAVHYNRPYVEEDEQSPNGQLYGAQRPRGVCRELLVTAAS